MGSVGSVPIPCHRRPRLLLYKVFQVTVWQGWRQRARCYRVWTVSVSKTERVRGSYWLPCRTLDAAHCSMNLGGKLRDAVERAETRERVHCATGSGVLSAMSMGTTLGCGAVTLRGDMATLGVGTGRVEGGAGVVATGETG